MDASEARSDTSARTAPPLMESRKEPIMPVTRIVGRRGIEDGGSLTPDRRRAWGACERARRPHRSKEVSRGTTSPA